jgi:YesN/AraC family two-component response regulator
MLNLMLVDDEPFMLKGLMNIIEKGATPCSEVVKASDGFEALEKLEAFRPDLLITDIQMPEMSGLELIRQARERGLCKRFIILSGYDDAKYMRQAIKCQVIDYLMKPIDKAELYDLLANISIELLNQNAPAGAIGGTSHTAPDPTIDELQVDHLSKNVKKIIQYIDKHYTQDISLDQIADHVFLHPNYISALFRKETGLTFIHYLHLFRIKKAKEMMIKEVELSFHQISERVGYESVRHFFNVFKKYSGATPGEYREQFKLQMRV